MSSSLPFARVPGCLSRRSALTSYTRPQISTPTSSQSSLGGSCACLKAPDNSLPTVIKRHEATAQRLFKRLKRAPAPSFKESRIMQDHIVYNPPPSAPSAYHTPMKFLPKSDPRRQLYAAALAAETKNPTSLSSLASLTSSSSSSTKSPSSTLADTLPAPLKEPQKKQYHLTDTHLSEIRALRSQDPRYWTRVRLAEKFKCSEFFVSLVCQHAPGVGHTRKKEQQAVMDALRSKWGPRKKLAREDRQRRRKTWGRVEGAGIQKAEERT